MTLSQAGRGELGQKNCAYEAKLSEIVNLGQANE